MVPNSYRFSNYRLNVVKESLLGTIKEVEVVTPDYKYLVQNKQFGSVVGARTTYLEVKRNIKPCFIQPPITNTASIK